MERLLFSEEQSFRQSFVPWLMLAVIVAVIAGFGVAMYQQFYLGQTPDDATSKQELIWGSIISIVVMSGTFLFILNRKLITEIWADGIRYKFAPFVRKMKHIPLTEIASVEVAKYKPIVEFGGWGVRKKLFARKIAYNISGNIGLRVTLKNGSQIVFGTRQENEMKRAVDKMMHADKNKFGM
jgi:hypothetical protein